MLFVGCCYIADTSTLQLDAALFLVNKQKPHLYEFY